MVDTPCSLVWGCWTSSPPELWLWGLHFVPLNKGRVSPVVTMGLQGCSTFSQPGNWFRGLFFAAGSMVAFFIGVLAGCYGEWPPWGFPLEEPCPETHPHQRRRGSTLSLPKALSHSPPKGMVDPPVGRLTFSLQNWRARVYATFCLCWISQISWQAKMKSGGGKDTAVQVEPDGHSSPGIVHSSLWELKRGPYLTWQLFVVVHPRYHS